MCPKCRTDPAALTYLDQVVTVRRLQRETPAVLREVEELGRPVVVTRDGEEIVRIVPLSPADRLWRSWAREAGEDPDDLRFRLPTEHPPLPGPFDE